MIKQINYKVLWVDDDESIIHAYATLAEVNYNLSLDVAPDWETAEEKLRVHFREYSAIILDANCKLNKSDSKPSESFLGQASVRLSRIFGEKHEFIPWYILSAGTMNQFDTVLALINTEERQNMEFVWGELLYRKDSLGEDGPDALFKRIVEVSNDKTINKVLLRHADVFKYLGKGKLIDYVQARNYMLKMLSALYNPEENLNFEYEGNPLRKVLEYVFRTAHYYGLLPNECIDNQGHIVLLDASRFMGGLNINCYQGRNVTQQIRYGTAGEGKDGRNGDSIFTQDVAMYVKNILNFSSSDSHTNRVEIYSIKDDIKELFFSYVLQLSHIIKWFGKYIEEHPNKEENKERIQVVESISFVASPINTKKDTSLCISNTPTKESIIGTAGIAMYIGNVVAIKGCCKLLAKDKKYVLKNIKIVELSDNTEVDKVKFPYVITKFEVLN